MENDQISTGEILKAIDRLVREGRVVLTTINGKPAVKLVPKDKPKNANS